MKKLKILSVFTAIVMTLTFTACGDKKPAESGGEYVVKGADLSTDFIVNDNNRVFYEIFVGSFSDSNGDGIGDLRGIINRFDYLNDGKDNSGKSLGVEGIWLTPIFKSSSYHKYDANDYMQIDSAFGTEDDLKDLIELCHKRNVKIILDLAINHTGTGHDWFKKFTAAHKTANTENKYYDFYSYVYLGENVPSNRRYNMLNGTDIQYECNFDNGMPELNFDNEDVRQAVLDVAKHYLSIGVDGFRFDAAKYIYYGDNAKSAEFWKWYIGELKKVKSDVYTVAEVWDPDMVTDVYYPATNCFNFTTSGSLSVIADAAQEGNVNSYMNYLSSYYTRISALSPDAMYIPFISNHDMDRAAGFLTVTSGQMFIAANLYILTKGSPFIYYGEEIGMKGTRGSSNTDANRRLAMLWGDGDTVKNPVGSTYSADYQTNGTVKDQLTDKASLYNHYKKLLMIRKANPEIARGEHTTFKLSDKAGGFAATYNGSTVGVIHNTTNRTIEINLAEETKMNFTKLRSVIGLGGATLKNGILSIDGKTSVILK